MYMRSSYRILVLIAVLVVVSRAAGCLVDVCAGALPTEVFLRRDAGDVCAVVHG